MSWEFSTFVMSHKLIYYSSQIKNKSHAFK